MNAGTLNTRLTTGPSSRLPRQPLPRRGGERARKAALAYILSRLYRITLSVFILVNDDHGYGVIILI